MDTNRAFDAVKGDDAALRSVLARAARVAPTRLPVLITGESGTGKELLAQALHALGPAPAGPFVAVNCGALPRDLAESELFGHERGAFTGAAARRLGWFGEAHGGTLVLDEVGELPPALQPKLLRVLETGRLRRVGGTGDAAVDVRVVAMTLRDLGREAATGVFRVDLYHRLAGVELRLPPLRSRLGDVPVLARRFLAEIDGELGGGNHPARGFAPEALDRLVRHAWPGNVRELRNVVRRAALFCGADRIDADALDLPPPCRLDRPRVAEARLQDAPSSAYATETTADEGRETTAGAADDGKPAATAAEAATPDAPGDLLALEGRTFEEIERAVLRWALVRAGGSRRQAARTLAMARSTFCDKVKRYGLA